MRIFTEESEAYLEPNRTSTIEFFLQKKSIVDVRLGSKHATEIIPMKVPE